MLLNRKVIIYSIPRFLPSFNDSGHWIIFTCFIYVYYPLSNFYTFLLSMDSDLSAATFHCAKLALVLFFMLER